MFYRIYVDRKFKVCIGRTCKFLVKPYLNAECCAFRNVYADALCIVTVSKRIDSISCRSEIFDAYETVFSIEDFVSRIEYDRRISVIRNRVTCRIVDRDPDIRRNRLRIYTVAVIVYEKVVSLLRRVCLAGYLRVCNDSHLSGYAAEFVDVFRTKKFPESLFALCDRSRSEDHRSFL